MTSHQMVSLCVVVYFLMTVSAASSENQYAPEITSYTDKKLFSAGETVSLTCRSRNTGNTQSVLSWHSSRNGVRNITRQVSDGSIQLDILQIPTEYDGMSVTCVETGNLAETQSSITIRVDTWGSWSSWTCSVTCGTGTMSRTRTCTPPSATCSGDASDKQECQRPACCVPRHGQWYNWGSWSSCSVSCGQGTRTRSRTCYGQNACGRPCEGNNSTEEYCNDSVCPGSPDMASLTVFNYSNYADLRCLVAKEFAQKLELLKVTSNGTRITKTLTSRANYVDFRLDTIQCEDAGIYFCRATKGLKIANSTAVQLNIPCYPRRPPGTPTTPDRIEVMEGSGAQYTFTVIAHPVPTIEDISYHTEDTVSSLQKEPVRSDFISGNCQQNTPDLHLVTCSLSITDALRTDDGLYSLKVRNSKGHVNLTFELSVIGTFLYLGIFYCLRVELSNCSFIRFTFFTPFIHALSLLLNYCWVFFLSVLFICFPVSFSLSTSHSCS
ncbi:uncharacterized protein LOC112568849 [Pomacea canaliculata]|uniref:uncharacterized protein LOC112568849 n=1 Tax=Pomacea canaliculata TaxID=400727 RepID=UPI000D73CD80|nr:uncharacterized protein LOC112568849 [Pomacea canaliculata]